MDTKTTVPISPPDLSAHIPPKPTDIPTDGGRYVDWLGRTLEASRRKEYDRAYWYSLEMATYALNFQQQSMSARMAQEYLELWRNTQ